MIIKIIIYLSSDLVDHTLNLVHVLHTQFLRTIFRIYFSSVVEKGHAILTDIVSLTVSLKQLLQIGRGPDREVDVFVFARLH